MVGVLEKNSSVSGSGALHLTNGCKASITDCTFDKNAGGYGGALFVAADAEAKTSGSTFTDNTSAEQGSAIMVDGIVTLEDTSITGNIDKAGNAAGYVLTVTDHEGYGGDIQFAMGVRSDGTMNGISFLSISETAGLGMKAAEEGFMKQFENKNVEKFQYTKNGASVEGDVDAISGATITTNAVVNGVNAGLYYISTLE